ncbi:polyketide synthase [Streptomyces griseocarneus]|nr:polyketide synthase [Streptomyces griseocarneus]
MTGQHRHGPDARTPVAVIGMGCAYPGAWGTDELWELLVDGVDAVGDIPGSRYDTEEFHAPRPGMPGRTTSRRGGFLDGLAEAVGPDAFPAEEFGVEPHEIADMDPQQRLLLLTARAALRDAGLPAERHAGSRTAVFVGQSHSDHWDALRDRGLDTLDLGSFSGSHQRGLLAGRLSYAFDLRGPSVTVDTAQASSLVALHLAVRSLRSGEADMALAGGVSLVLGPAANVMLSQAGALSPDGRCKFGDATADGFVRSEGAGVVVLKPLDRALADGDRVRAVILGSAVSNDGRAKDRLTDPSREGQATAMRWAYEDAGITPGEVAYVEAHGTGTRIDPVELGALTDVLGEGRPADRPCLVGSLKSNIGHTEAAAGVGGVIKTVLALEHGTVPPSLHFTTPHPAVDWDALPLVVPTRPRHLSRRDGRPVIAAVNGQSISSTNVHLVLAQALRIPGTGH